MTAPPELTRMVALDAIVPPALHITVTADAAERAAVAARLQLPAIAALACRFTLERIGPRGFIVAAAGTLQARVTQLCVRTLDPFEAAVSERFTVRFVPVGEESAEDDPEADDEIAYAGAELDLGEATVEQLALALDPYPHRPGADAPLDMTEDAEDHPFAALRRRDDPDGT